jgi:multiple sugar transport system substrate-binding protein
LAAGVTATTVLAACVVTPPPGAAPPAAKSEEVAPAPPPEKAEITAMYHGTSEIRRVDQVAAFNEKYPDITVKIEEVPEDFPTKVFTLAAANSLPDVVRVWEPHVLEFGRAGQLRDLQPMIDVEPEFNSEDFYESFYNFPVIGGQRFGVADDWNGHLAYYNQDLFDAAGVAYPTEDWTWDDHVEMARQISKPDQGIWGTGMFFGWLHWNYKLIWQNGGQVYNEDYTACLLDSPEAAEGIQYWADLAQAGEIMPGPAGEEPHIVFEAGKAGMMRNGTWVMAGLAEKDFAWNLLPEPKQKERRTLLHTAFHVIPTTTENTDAAWKYLNFVVSPEGILIVTKGSALIGTRRSVNEERPWAREGVEADWDLVPQAAEYGILVPAPPNVGEVEKFQNDALQAIYIQGQKAADVFKEVAPKVTEVLQQGA